MIDDEMLIANTLAMILATNGYETKVAYSAEQAIEALSDFSPDVALSDVMMDKLTGVDLAIYLSKHNPACRVLLISGHPGTAEILKAQQSQELPLLVLPKPVRPDVILDFLKAATAVPQQVGAAPTSVDFTVWSEPLLPDA